MLPIFCCSSRLRLRRRFNIAPAAHLFFFAVCYLFLLRFFCFFAFLLFFEFCFLLLFSPWDLNSFLLLALFFWPFLFFFFFFALLPLLISLSHAQALKQQNVHETLVKVGGYILGEFGHLIADQAGSGPQQQFDLLHAQFGLCSLPVRAMLLSTYAKFVNLYPELTAVIKPIFLQHQTFMDAEVQQRAWEYEKLISGSEQLLVCWC